jgi:hypothetical protein
MLFSSFHLNGGLGTDNFSIAQLSKKRSVMNLLALKLPAARRRRKDIRDEMDMKDFSNMLILLDKTSLEQR